MTKPIEPKPCPWCGDLPHVAGDEWHWIGLALTQFFAGVARWEAEWSRLALIAAVSRQLHYMGQEADHEAERAQRLHRRAQLAESHQATWRREAERNYLRSRRMESIVRSAWLALPKYIRDEITKPMQLDGSEGSAAPDLVRGVKMLVERTGR